VNQRDYLDSGILFVNDRQATDREPDQQPRRPDRPLLRPPRRVPGEHLEENARNASIYLSLSFKARPAPATTAEAPPWNLEDDIPWKCQ
jgi:hypothetical protein